MKVLLTIPSFGFHGGLNVVIQWCNRLTQWHDVYLYNLSGKNNQTWCKVNDKVKMCGPEMLWEVDCIILTSPHAADLLDLVLPHQKCFLFLQMMEHMFRPGDKEWMRLCKKFYTAPYPMFSISRWNMEMLREKFGRSEWYKDEMETPCKTVQLDSSLRRTHYITNGIDLDQFPISTKPKDGKTVLVEGWEPGNPTKDVDYIGAKVAKRLRGDGYRIIAYGSTRPKYLPLVPHEFHYQPDLKTMNDLYERATILIKATKYDARSTAPIEAMTKCTATVRAIADGDDDLDMSNSYRCLYNEDQLYAQAKWALEFDPDRVQLRISLPTYLSRNCNWDRVMNEVNTILCQ